ncbi:hypothetical protein ACFRFJ_15700 [Streptomyces hydrogenans]|uniref:hypothetical protein n=1 Tax=Streptomyces hydrogenans TaxID=1873719 RepID=UPI0036A555D9
MTFTMSPPLALALLLAVTVSVAFLAGRLPNFATYGLYAIAVGFDALHSVLYGSHTWALASILFASALTVAWWRGGGRLTIRRALRREPRR